MATDFERISALAPPKWDRGAAEKEGRRMFPSGTLRMVAAALAGAHPRALDYLRQAPVIILAVAVGRPHRANANRMRTAMRESFGIRCKRGERLREVMKAYGCAPPLRALHPRALTLSRWVAIRRLGEMPPQRLAPLIPADVRAQETWLRALGQWTDHVRNRAPDPWLGFEWAAGALQGDVRWGEARVTAVADLFIAAAAGRSRAGLVVDPRWTFDQAHAAAERWHAALAREQGERRFYEHNRFDFDHAIDYAPLWNEPFQIGAYEVVPLRSGRDLYEEGAAMHHCVGSYSRQVFDGRSRIFSLRRDGGRVATVEIGGAMSGSGRPCLRQVRGPCNTLPAPEVFDVARALEDGARDACPPGDGFPFRRADIPEGRAGNVTINVGGRIFQARGVMRIGRPQ